MFFFCIELSILVTIKHVLRNQVISLSMHSLEPFIHVYNKYNVVGRQDKEKLTNGLQNNIFIYIYWLFKEIWHEMGAFCYCIQHMKRRWTSNKNANTRPKHSFSVKVGNYTKIVSRATKLNSISENDTTSPPRNRLCPIVARAIPKARFKRKSNWCCHDKPPPTPTKIIPKQDSFDTQAVVLL